MLMRKYERIRLIGPTGVWAMACMQGDQTQHGKPQR
jgi:hypothetical protein